MHPILLKLGGISIYSYGFMVAVGFCLVSILVYRRAPKFGISGDRMVDYLILILATGVAGARILYVLINFEYYRANPIETLNLSKGGLVWYGGFGAALLASILFARLKKLDLITILDLMAPYIALGQAFGRVGCYLNGCCYGIASPEHFLFGEIHPTQLYSAALLLVIFAILIKWQGKIKFKGEIFLGYCILYSCKRFLVEFLRGDNARILAGLTMSQLISVVIFISAIVIFKIKADQWGKKVSSGSKRL